MCYGSRQVGSAVGGEWTERQHPLCGGKYLLFKVATCHKWGPQGIDIGLRLLNIFVSDLEDGIKCTLTKFVHGPKLRKERRSHPAGRSRLSVRVG